ncbi:uncharacterized protein Z518_06122 [Rhinocladiella mackenziei CBS 650.93]|uniref:Rhinocladiella mackenziei CBS 650.93 unplaced genomic scaffold supercont1.4, whole genome shotgun sequence n=1 Tax=Rhinocladiella mackenziei CBS 650.93 TaxID=1442369 RepID=A0A0D2J856_9EURO|nr:uncharacterized protein Z518_06122 [Rhinocladiella mackenziei CBS 650.93]KIX05250.1 hypothetical protein Z518_06122 [Rhinocladiella mackenziei CBS 650.93]
MRAPSENRWNSGAPRKIRVKLDLNFTLQRYTNFCSNVTALIFEEPRLELALGGSLFFILRQQEMATDTHAEKEAELSTSAANQDGSQHSPDVEEGTHAPARQKLGRDFQSRHMQMIAIGGSIGAGLFISSGGALYTGGPAALLVGYLIIGVMILCTVQALGELAVMYPVNGAYYVYAVRFIDPAWGFAMGWQYVRGWLITLPFEITAAGITISYWHEYNISIWIVVFLSLLVLVQYFGVKGYGEVEFILGLIKIIAIVGFVIFGIVVDCGANGNTAFRNGFKGFCTVFVVAAFAFAGTELVSLAAAEAANPLEALPKATRQVIFRIAGLYITSLLIVGLIVPNNSVDLLGASGANTKASPFVLAIQYAGVKGLPSAFNAVITISVLSVANSCTYGSTRTMQALAADGMAPRFLAWIDHKSRPFWPIIIQLLFGLLAFINLAASGETVFYWLLAISGLSVFFIWGSICLSHIRFRAGWKAAGRSLDEIPSVSPLGVTLVCVCLIATFYVALFPIGGEPNAEAFLMSYLAAPIAVVLFIFWKFWSKDSGFLVKVMDMDLDSGRREFQEYLETIERGSKAKQSLGRRVMGLFV